MASHRMNVLVYSGNGSTVESVRHCLYTLRRLLAPNYAVIPVTGDMLIKEPWTPTCAALVFPGGADQGYCRTLNGEGNRRIRRFVENGGIYIGFCAGGYYGSKRCEFEVGNKELEVVGDRELAFYPGSARGCAFAGFVYHSEKGARAAELKVDKTVISSGSVPNLFKSYYNGGGVFVDAPKYRDQGVEVLASYTEKLAVDAGDGSAAIVYCKVGQGAALLTGPHPEFVFLGKPADDWSLTKPRYAVGNLEKKRDAPGFDDVITELARDENHRMDFLKACLTKLGLKISDEQNVPSLSRMHLSAAEPNEAEDLLKSLDTLITTNERGEEYIKDDNDTFHILKPSTWSLMDLDQALPSEDQPTQSSDTTSDRITDYNTITKHILVHTTSPPPLTSTPYFNHAVFYSRLTQHHSSHHTKYHFGTHLLYGHVVTSTNTLLEKNTHLLRLLPHGFTATATIQLAGRGRGSNVWVSPSGSLMFSTVIRHPMASMQAAPVVFIQYLAAMAVVQALKTHDSGKYKDLPVHLKWPNDIYALDPSKAAAAAAPLSSSSSDLKNYVKIGGILINSHYNAETFIAVAGVGLNLSNTQPSLSLNQLLPPDLPKLNAESFLATILFTFEQLYTRFLRTGFAEEFQQMYYQHWLHSDQIVTLESQGGERARIKGITHDYGLLVAEEVHGERDEPTGKQWQLQSDANSFDFFAGLIKRKV